MKNFIVMAVAAFAMMFALSSCETCTTCSYDDPNFAIAGESEACGKKDDIEEFEATFENAAAMLGTTATCTRN